MSKVKMYLTKRANGTYYICIKSPDGSTHWKSTKCTKKPDAYHYLTSFEESYNSKPPTDKVYKN